MFSIKRLSTGFLILISVVLAGMQIKIANADEMALGQQAEQAGKLHEAFEHYIVALKSSTEGSHEEQYLRENALKLVPKVKPLPIISEEVRRHIVRGRAAVKAAKNKQRYLRAANELKMALRNAPWLAEGYYNLGVVLDIKGDNMMRPLRTQGSIF